MKCPSCGYDKVPNDARFCPECGKEFLEPSKPSPQISVVQNVGEVEGAVSYFCQAAQADPEYSDAHTAIVWLQQSRAMHDIEV